MIKVMCVDDSALIRQLLTEIINSQPDMEVVAVAPDPLVARDLIKIHNPDVLTLDVEMPRMDGIDFLGRLMRLKPMPVVMISSLTQKGSDATLQALELGAVDFISKPQYSIRDNMHEYARTIAEKIRAAAVSKPKQMTARQGAKPSVIEAPMLTSEKLLIIGSSTGGTEALRVMLEQMPTTCPAIMIAQHMPEGFTKSFAERMNRLCSITVKEAQDGERLMPGHAYIAPGSAHLKLSKSGANYLAELDRSEPVNRHRPSVDVLFNSAAKYAGRNAIGVILTGMGKDGAAGLLKMRESGAYTYAQSENTCVVFGMPKEAIAINAACEVCDLQDISRKAIAKFQESGIKHRI